MPVKPMRAKTDENLLSEILQGVISSTYLRAAGDMGRALPRYVDDAERDFGPDIYERMLRDPALQSSHFAIKSAVLSEGPRFLSPIPQPPPFNKDATLQANHERGEEIRLWTNTVFDELQSPLEEILDEALDYLGFGSSVAEQTYKRDGDQLKLAKLQIKPRRNYVFAVSGYMDVLGVVDANQASLSQAPGTPGQVMATSGASIDPSLIIPRSKLLILSFKPRGGDPRGTSLLRAAYNAWYLKQQAWPNLLKYLALCGTPSVVGIAPPDAGDVTPYGDDAIDGETTGTPITPEKAMLNKLLAFQSGTALALPNGASVQFLETSGDGKGFTDAIDLYNREMVMAVIIAVRTILEAEHGSKADSGTGQDILGVFAQQIRRYVEMAVYRDVIRPMVALNFGEETARTMTPTLSLSNVAQENRIEMMNAVGNLNRSAYLHSSQFAGLDAMLGIPERDAEAQQAEEAARALQEADRKAMLDLGLGMPQPPVASVQGE